MTDPKKILREADSRMLVQLSVEELRGLVAEVVEQKLAGRLAALASGSGLLNTEQAAKFLGYSKHWIYKNWQAIGGKKIGKRGVRFDAAELQKWVESRRGA